MLTAADIRREIRARSGGDLARLFAEGRLPDPPPDGRYRGDVLRLTLAPGVDEALRGALRRWPPWLGKRFDADAGRGENVFSSRLVRAVVDSAPFETSTGPSAMPPGRDVLRIDYRGAGNPPPVRAILDEVVDVGDGVLLGHALLRAGARPRRLAWFCLW